MRLVGWALVAGLVAACGRSELSLENLAPEHEDASAPPAMSAGPDASVECTPPVLGGTHSGPCTLCDGLYYCPGFPPSPPCGPDLHQSYEGPYSPCTTTCIACPGDGVQESDPSFAKDAWLWQCNTDGSGPPNTANTFTLIVSVGDPCP